MFIIYKSGNISEAHIIAGLLNSQNIQAHVDGVYLQGGIGDLAVNDFVNVKVAEQDVDQALWLIAEYESKPIDDVDGEISQAQKTSSVAKFLLFLIVAVMAFLSFFFGY